MESIKVLLLAGLIKWALAQQQEFYCPGPATIECTTSPPTRTIWGGTAFNEQEQCPSNTISFIDINIGDIFSCGELLVNITNVRIALVDNFNVTLVNSTLYFNAGSSLNGLTVRCASGVATVLNMELLIPNITPNVTLIQDSPTAVTVTLAVSDTRCAVMYHVELTQVDSNELIMRSSLSSSVSVTDLTLDLCRYRYSVVGFVQTPSGSMGPRSSAQQFGMEAVANVNASSSTILSWTHNAPPGCITGYTISWRGGEDTTTGTSTSVDVRTLDNFPFCQAVTVRVTPSSLPERFSGSSSVFFRHPGFTVPGITSAFFSVSGTSNTDLILNVEWQEDLSSDGVPIRQFGFVETGQGLCEATIESSGSSGSVSVSGAEPGDIYTVCVSFTNEQCTESVSSSITVPVVIISNPQVALQGSSMSVTVTLLQPPPISPDLLYILSTISPPPASRIVDDYPASSSQHTVIFSNLTPEKVYTYKIIAVLRNDSRTTLGLPVTGSFFIPGSLSQSATVAISVVLTFILTLVVGVSIGVLSVLVVNKCRRSERVTLQTETEMISPPAIYEEPDVKPDPQTQGNVAYGHVQYR